MYEKLPINDKFIKTSRIYDVPIDRIVQINTLLRSYDTVSVVKLASSIQKIGLIEPIILRLPCQAFPEEPEKEFTEPENTYSLPRPTPEKLNFKQIVNDKIADIRRLAEIAKGEAPLPRYALISGGYRLRAYKMLGLATIPARFALFTQHDEASIQMIGEFFGSCSDIFEKSRKFVKTCIDLDMNACELAEKLGFQRKYAISLFNIAKMSDSEADLASLHKLSFETIAAIATVESPIARLALIEEAKDGRFSAKELKDTVEDVKNGKRKNYTQQRKFFCKDMRIYMNTMKKTVNAMVENGLDAKLEIVEAPDVCTVTVTVNQNAANPPANVSRETLSISVEKEQKAEMIKSKFVENSVETDENLGNSLKNAEFSTQIKDIPSKSSKTVEKCVENVENREFPTNANDGISDEATNVDTQRQTTTANAVSEVI